MLQITTIKKHIAKHLQHYLLKEKDTYTKCTKSTKNLNNYSPTYTKAGVYLNFAGQGVGPDGRGRIVV